MAILIPKGYDDDKLLLHRFSRMTEREFRDRLALGERFVVYQCTLSALIYTATRPTRVHHLKSKWNAIARGLPYSLISLLFGWWFFPSGPVQTVISITRNTGGGTDVSAEIIEHIRSQDPRYQYGML